MDIYHANPGSCPSSNVLRMLKLVAVDRGYLFNYFLRQGDNVFTSLVCLLAGLRKNYATDFDRIRWKEGTRAAEETVRFWRLIRITLR